MNMDDVVKDSVNVKVTIDDDGTLEFTDGKMFISFYSKNGKNIVSSFFIDKEEDGFIDDFVEMERLEDFFLSFDDVIRLFDNSFNLKKK